MIHNYPNTKTPTSLEYLNARTDIAQADMVYPVSNPKARQKLTQIAWGSNANEYHPARIKQLWQRMRRDAYKITHENDLLRELLHRVVVSQSSFAEALTQRLAEKLASGDLAIGALRSVIGRTLANHPSIVIAAHDDVLAVLDRDPACAHSLQPILFFKGFLALQCHRIAHAQWTLGQEDVARLIQSRTAEVFGVDIHPGARIGSGVVFDHAESIVIGETAVVGNDVTVLHSVTLGGTGREGDDRHPKIGDGVLLGAGSIVLGNIKIGCHAKIAAGSVVVKDVQPGATVAGVPARLSC